MTELVDTATGELTYEEAPADGISEAAQHATDGLPPDLEDLYGRAEEVSQYNALTLKAMSMLAYEHRENPVHMRCLSLWWGRNARHLAAAVARFPEWFYGKDGAGPLEASPDEVLALWAMCAVGKSESEKIYRQFRDNGLKSYQVKDLVELAKTNWKASHGQPVRLRVKSGMVRPIEGAVEGVNGVELTWLGDPILDKAFWNEKMVQAQLLFKSDGPAAPAEAPGAQG